MSTFIEIIEQPISSIRFRYESERRWNDNLIGQHSTSRTRTYPMVRVNGYPGNEDLIIEASCVSAEGPPYKTHPFKLLGHNCQDGICWAEVDKLTGIATFSKLSVQCVTVKQIPDSLKLREYRNVDPFNQKFHHAANPKSIDTKKIKLCFRLFRKNKEEPICAPIVSNVIHSQVSVHDDLKIVFLGSKSAPMGQEQEITLFCNKLKDDNIAITLFRGKPGEPDYWQAYANIILIHMKVAIAFKTPIYTGKLEANDKPVKVYIQMCNPLDGSFSNAVPFHFVPNHSIPVPRSLNGPTIVRNPMPQTQPNTDRISSSTISSTTPSSAIHRPYLHGDDIAYCWRELSTMRQMYMDMLKFLTLSTQKRSQSRYSPY